MQDVLLTVDELRRLLPCGNADAAALYLYYKAALPPEAAAENLHMPLPRLIEAKRTLAQLGLLETPARAPMQPERPTYTEQSVREAMKDGRFPSLVGEAQRRLGRTLSGEELKTLLSMTDYLRFAPEVVGLLLSYCIERARRQGGRTPSMRTIEREAYHWSDEGIDTLERASHYVTQQLQTIGRIEQLRLLLLIDDRRLTAAEEKYLTAWVEMGFPDASIRLAYERTCLNTGGLKWKYMNSILESWHSNGLHTPEQIERGDTPPSAGRNSGFQRHTDALSARARQAVALAMAEGNQDEGGLNDGLFRAGASPRESAVGVGKGGARPRD